MSRKGRKRKPAKRHPNGRIVQPSPAQKQDDALQGPLEARTRVYGIPLSEAAKITKWSALGRLCHSKAISERQMEAGEAYARVVDRARKAYLVKPLQSGSNIERIGGRALEPANDQDYTDQCRDAIRTYEACRRALLESPDPLAMMACEAFCVNDETVHRLEDSLRIGLNVLVRILLGEAKRAA